MTPSNSELRAQLGTDLKLLQAALREFATHLLQHAQAAWVWTAPRSQSVPFSRASAGPSKEEALRRLVEGIQKIKYEDGQDPHESHICPGIVAVSRGGIALADEVNRIKRSLADVLRQMEGRNELGVTDQQTGERGPRPLREVALEAFYFRRLHYRQATRRLEVLRESDTHFGTLEYVGFMWANSREVRKTSATELIKQATAPGVRALSDSDLSILEGLPADEPLALVTPGQTTPKANIRFAAHDGEPAVTKVRVAVLPLVMLGESLPKSFRKLPPTPTPKSFRLPRGDVEVGSEPLLTSLPVHRYLEQFRSSKK